MRALAGIGFSLALAACSLGVELPEGRIRCSVATDCPAHWACVAQNPSGASESGLCYRVAADGGELTIDSAVPREGGANVDAGGSDAAPVTLRDAGDADIGAVDSGLPVSDASQPPGDAAAGDARVPRSDASVGPVPVIDAVLLGNRYLNPAGKTSASCLASDPSKSVLSYMWSASKGKFDDNTLKTTMYSAGMVGPATVSCAATNAVGNSASSSQSVRVYPAGWLTLLRFSLDSTDLSGNGNDGTVKMGAYGSDRAGVTGSALQLDGTGSVTLSNVSAFSLTAWSFVATLSPSAGHGGTLVSKGDTAFGAFTILLYADNDASLPGRLQYYQASDQGSTTSLLGGNFRAQGNTFFQLAVTRSAAGELRTYIDGVLMSTDSAIPPTVQNNASVVLGNGPLGAYWGVLDEVQLYGRVLDASEVSALTAMQ